MKILNKSEKSFPERLLNLDKPPERLRLSSPWDFSANTISVVGARNMRPWVLQWLESELLPLLKKYEIGLVSGGARGVDQAVHRLAIRAQRPTLAFLPSGLECIYPDKLKHFQSHSEFVMATEYENKVEMRKHHFYHRNRLIAGLSPILIVVQAQKKSGTMMTARLAIENGCTVATLPGHVLDPEFSGNNQLLYDGAQMVRSFTDLETLLLSNFSVIRKSNI